MELSAWSCVEFRPHATTYYYSMSGGCSLISALLSHSMKKGKIFSAEKEAVNWRWEPCSLHCRKPPVPLHSLDKPGSSWDSHSGAVRSPGKCESGSHQQADTQPRSLPWCEGSVGSSCSQTLWPLLQPSLLPLLTAWSSSVSLSWTPLNPRHRAQNQISWGCWASLCHCIPLSPVSYLQTGWVCGLLCPHPETH